MKKEKAAVEEISIYDAIHQMRKLTSEGKSFSFVHATYNRDTSSTDGIRTVHRAKLRPAAKGEDVANSQFKLFYTDEDQKAPRNCWQPLIMFFNGKRCKFM